MLNFIVDMFHDYSCRYTGNADPQGMNEALQGISSEVQQLLWQMQTEVVMEAIKELRLARIPPGNFGSLRRGSNLEGLSPLQHSGPSGKLIDFVVLYVHIYVCMYYVYIYVYMYTYVCMHMYVWRYVRTLIHTYVYAFIQLI